MNAYTGIRGAYSEGARLAIQQQESKRAEQQLALQERQQSRLEQEQQQQTLANQATNILKFNYSPRSEDITNKYRTGQITLEEANKQKKQLSEEIYKTFPDMNKVIPGGEIWESINPQGFTEVHQKIDPEQAKKEGLDPNKQYAITQTVFNGKPVGDKKINELYLEPKEQATLGIAQLKAFGEQQTKLSEGEASLRQEFEKAPQVKEFTTVAQYYQRLLNVSNDPSAAGDLSIIFSYMKMLDPPSVVREGEQATAKNARGVPETLRSLYNRLLSGETLGTNQRQDFISKAKDLYSAQNSFYEARAGEFEKLAKARGFDPGKIILKQYPNPEPQSGKTQNTSYTAPSGKTYKLKF